MGDIQIASTPRLGEIIEPRARSPRGRRRRRRRCPERSADRSGRSRRAATTWRSCEARLGDMRDPAREIGLARGDDVVVAAVGDPGGEDHGRRQVHLVRDRPRELRRPPRAAASRPRAGGCGSDPRDRAAPRSCDRRRPSLASRRRDRSTSQPCVGADGRASAADLHARRAIPCGRGCRGGRTASSGARRARRRG